MKTCAQGHDNDNFNVQMEEVKGEFCLEAGTVWLPKNNEFQPLIQKNSCTFEPGKEQHKLYMFCGDKSKKSPYDNNSEYLPTTLKMKNVTGQSEVWEETQKYTK